ncbi:MAG: Mg-chelatase subunit ChlD [Verrucomicrobiales bacterium]|jgi:Mg-chelatase subunit ChlD
MSDSPESSPSLKPWIDPDLEARIVALVLGEASDFESEQLDRIIGERRELQIFRKFIESAHEQMAEIGAKPGNEAENEWRLGANRRATILNAIGQPAEENAAQIMAVRPAAAERKVPYRRAWIWRNAGAAAAAGLMFLIGSIAMMMSLGGDQGVRYRVAENFGNERDSNGPMSGGSDNSYYDRRSGSSKPAASAPAPFAAPKPAMVDSVAFESANELVASVTAEPTSGPVGITGIAEPSDQFGLLNNTELESLSKSSGPMPPPAARPDFRRANDGLASLQDNETSVERSRAVRVAPAGSTAPGGGGGAVTNGLGFDQNSLETSTVSGGKETTKALPEARESERQLAQHGGVAPIDVGRGAGQKQTQEAAKLTLPEAPAPAPAPAPAQPMPARPLMAKLDSKKEAMDEDEREEDESKLALVPKFRADLSMTRELHEKSESIIEEQEPRGRKSRELGWAAVVEPEFGDKDQLSQLASLNEELAPAGPPNATKFFSFIEANQMEREFIYPAEYDSPEMVAGFAVDSGVKARVQVKFPEILASAEPFSTFSLHVSDVSFKLARASLANGQWPEESKIRIEEFVNAFDYGDPMPSTAEKIASQQEQTAHPFLASRNLMRVSMRTAAAGRSSQTPLRLTILLDTSGSMEREDRRETTLRAFILLAQQLLPQDQVTLIGFSRQPRLLADRVNGADAMKLTEVISRAVSDGGTNLEAALRAGFDKAIEQKTEGAQNRIVLITDGAANLGDAEPERLAKIVEVMRTNGIAFDAAGVGAAGFNDKTIEALTRDGDGRYYFLDRPEDADAGFAKQIAGALRPAAMNVKIQVEFNPDRVGHYKLLGFEEHRLEKEDFRDDSVDAAELAAEEAGVAVYQIEPLPGGTGDVGTISVRFRDMASGRMVERRWPIPYEASPRRIGKAAPAVQIASVAALFAAKLKGYPVGEAADFRQLSRLLNELPERVRNEERVQQLLTMIEQARQLR